MVVFVDLEGDDDEPHSFGRHLEPPPHYQQQRLEQLTKAGGCERAVQIDDDTDPKPVNMAEESARLFASALTCYPVSLSLASHLDLIDLFHLSSTCRTVHDSLTQFAHQLRVHSLRCVNDVRIQPRDVAMYQDTVGTVFREAISQEMDMSISTADTPAFPLPFTSDGNHFRGGIQSSLGLTGRIGQCARDMVAPCRKCGTSVCRNCAVKPPSDRCLPERFRRLCQTCLVAPLLDHLQPLQNQNECSDSPPASSASSTRSTRSVSTASYSSQAATDDEPDLNDVMSFTTQAFLRQPCTCHSRGVYLCQPCGQNLRAADTTYKRVWTWRSRYSTHIGGGLGTGLGLGNQGQKCARGEHCLEKVGGGICWVEIECSEARAQVHGREDLFGISRSSTPSGLEPETEANVNKPGYLSQEIEGIGGVVKKKVKKRVKVGATVYEYDDERQRGKYLEREASGRQRGWCGWCFRLSPDEADKVEMGRLLELHS